MPFLTIKDMPQFDELVAIFKEGLNYLTMTYETKPKLELVTDLLKTILWPLIVIVIIIIFWEPIKGLIGNSDSITIGNFTLKLKNEIPTPSVPVKNILNKISSQEVSELLFIGNDTSIYNGYNEKSLKHSPISDMMDLNLVRHVEPYDGADTTNQYYKVTMLGSNTYNFYISLISAIGKQIDNPNNK